MDCDDGNLVNGDGCSSTCTVEAGWSCTGGSSISISVCTLPVTPTVFTVELIYTTKSTTSNTLEFYFQISPVDSLLDQLNLNNGLVVLCNGSSSGLTVMNLGQGIVQVELNYTSPLQDSNLSLVFDLAQGGVTNFTGSQPVTVPVTVQPNNNLPADYYQQTLYDSAKGMNIVCIALMCMYLIAFILGLLTKKYIAVETVAVGQVAFIGLSLIDYLGPALGSLNNLKYINGINTPVRSNSLNPSMATPRRLVTLDYDAPMIYNFNCVLIALLLPFLTAMILYFVSKCISSSR